MVAGLPTASAPGGTIVSLRTTEFAATIAPVQTNARCKTIAPDETWAEFAMVHDSR